MMKFDLMTRTMRRVGVGAGLLLLATWSLPAAAFNSFVVSDIRIEGLRRISAGTIFTYLPVKTGETFDEEASARAVRGLFKTGFFKDVRIARDAGDVLVVEVVERPAVSSIEFDGNKDIETDQLLEALKQTGLAQGQVFDRLLLDKVERELERQYFARGKYGVEVKTTVTPLERNRVALNIKIAEGKAARIRQIDIIGVKAFDVDDIRDRFELTGPGWFTFITKSDRYAKQKLAGDLEALRSFYLDRGYVHFQITSTQVTITPDKQEMYVTINVEEGEQYTVSEVKLAGDLVVSDQDLFDQVSLRKGQVFSRKDVTETSDKLSDRLGDEGYAFANVNAIPDINEEERTVQLTYFIDPGKRSYVRRINFRGNTKTADEVLRREMRQLEGAWFSTKKLERSRERLDRLGFFEEVNLETPAVPGAPDQVDAEFTVTEKPSGNFLAGIGYSQASGINFSTSVSQENFLGTGKRVAIAFNNSDISRVYSFAYTDPYHTVDGVSRGFSGYLRETDAAAANVSDYSTDVIGGSVNYGIPITEFDSVNFVVRVENTKVNTVATSSTEINTFIRENGDDYVTLAMELSWQSDSRNRALLPDAGRFQRLSGELAVPGGDLTYYKISYDDEVFVPLSGGFIGNFGGRVGYGDAYGDTNSLPFFEHYFAGGVRSVRGYKSNTLGPDDSRGDPFGGSLLVTASAEVIIPTPIEKYNKTLRLSGFFDMGNTFASQKDFDFGDLRQSTGVQAIWVSPFGPLTFVVAQPLNDKTGDSTETFQFTLGSTF